MHETRTCVITGGAEIIIPAFNTFYKPLPVIITGSGIHRDIGNDAAVYHDIDLVYAVAQILVMIRRHAVVLEQAFLKLDLPWLTGIGSVFLSRNIRIGLRRDSGRRYGRRCRLHRRNGLVRQVLRLCFSAGRKRDDKQCREHGGGK